MSAAPSPGPIAAVAEPPAGAAGTFASIAAPRRHDEPFVPRRSTLLWLCEREILRFLKIWPMTVAGQVMSSVLFILVFGIALGDHISGVAGVPYDQYIVPGLLVQAIVTVCYINGTATLIVAKTDRYFNDVLSSPLRWWELAVGLISGGLARGLLTGGLVLAFAVSLTGIGIERPPVLLAAVLATLVAASQVGVIAGVYARTFEQTFFGNTLILLPLTFLAGVFYSVDDLPAGWEAASHLNPIFYVVQAFQAGFLGRADVPAGLSLAAVVLVAAALSGWSAWLLRTGARLKA